MTGLTRWVLRHKLLVVAFWLLIAVAGAGTAGKAVQQMKDTFSLPGAGVATDNQISALYHAGGNTDPVIPVVTAPAGESVANPATAATAARVLDAARVSSGVRLTELRKARDGQTAYAFAFVPPDSDNGTAIANRMRAAMVAAAPSGWSTGVTGYSLLSSPPTGKRGTGVQTATMLAALGALLVLAFVFASLLAIAPLLMGLVSVFGAFLLAYGLTEITTVSQVTAFLIALIGLGVAIDYSLIVVTRWREERARLGVTARGKAALTQNYAAIEATMAQAGRSVVFSGLTVAVGLLALTVVPVGFVRSTGFAGMFVPLVSVLAAITLLPVLLATIGPWLDWPRLRREGSASRPWSAWARLVFRHKWVAAIGGSAVLAVLIAPAFAMHVGLTDPAADSAPNPALSTFRTLTSAGVPAGVITPLEILVRGDDGQSVTTAAAHVANITTAFATGFTAWGTTLVLGIPAAPAGSPAGLGIVADIRAGMSNSPQVIGVGGDGPAIADFNHAIFGNFPLMVGLIGLATFILLARAFRSVLLAAKAVLFNLLSLGAAFGVMTFVWQEGHGSRLWGVAATGDITMWVPLLVFAFLFGLSMDYEVFILTRAREAFDETGSTFDAVTSAIGRTGRLVTCAALVLLLAFIALSTSPQVDVAVLATGLGAGIIVDATVVRCLMVPALVALFGRYNWWLPTGLARLLRVPASPLLTSAFPGPQRRPAAADATGS